MSPVFGYEYIVFYFISNIFNTRLFFYYSNVTIYSTMTVCAILADIFHGLVCDKETAECVQQPTLKSNLSTNILCQIHNCLNLQYISKRSKLSSDPSRSTRNITTQITRFSQQRPSQQSPFQQRPSQ